MLFITPSIRATVNSSTIQMERLFLRLAKPVTRTRIVITLLVLQTEKQVQMEANLDLSTADLDQFKIHQATTTQIKQISCKLKISKFCIKTSKIHQSMLINYQWDWWINPKEHPEVKKEEISMELLTIRLRRHRLISSRARTRGRVLMLPVDTTTSKRRSITGLWFSHVPIKCRDWLLVQRRRWICRDHRLLKVEPIRKEDKEAQEDSKLRYEDSSTQYMGEVCRYKETVDMRLTKTARDSWQRYSKINTPDKLRFILRITLTTWTTPMDR